MVAATQNKFQGRQLRKLVQSAIALLCVCLLPFAASAQTAKLFHGEYPGNRTFMTDLDGSNRRTLTSGTSSGILDIEVDKAGGHLYWTGFTSNGLYRSRLDGSGAALLYNFIGNPFGLALDRANQRLFAGGWTSGLLQCGSMNGGGILTTLVNAGTQITDVEYNPSTGFLYYGVVGSGIWRVQMGTGCAIVGSATRIVADSGRPYGIALDNASNKIWWTNFSLSRISRANLDGSSANLNFCSGLEQPTGISFLNNTLYYSDYGADRSFSTPASSCSPTQINTSALNRPWGIAAVQFNPAVKTEKSTNGVDADTAPGPQIFTGSPVTWRYSIRNTGDTVLATSTLQDNKLGQISNRISGDLDGDGELDAEETWVYEATGTATTGQYSNIGTFSGQTPLENQTLSASNADPSHYTGVSRPQLLSFTSTTANGTYGPGSVITIRANYNQTLLSDSSIAIRLTNGVNLTLNTVSGNSLSRIYTVGATGSGQDSPDLSVQSISSENVQGSAGGTQSGSTVPSAPNNLGDSSNIVIDVTAPTLAEITPVPTPGSNTNPQYTYSSSEVGTNVYGGGCGGVDTTANAGSNTDTLDSNSAGAPFAEGTYSNCTVTVTDSYGNVSAPLAITPFTIDLSPPKLISFSSATADGTYGPGSTINLTARYDSPLGSGSSISITLNNGVNVTLTNVSGSEIRGSYTVGATGSGQDSADLSVASISSESVSDTPGNTQNASTLPASPENLGDSSDIAIDTTAPTPAEVTAVVSPSSNQNPDYTYSSNEAGSAVFSGGCDSAMNTAAVGSNTVTLDSDGAGSPLSPGTYANCELNVTDIYGNTSSQLAISSFEIRAVAPGGVSAGLELWFKADAESYADNGTTPAGESQTVQRWSDQSGNNYDALQTEDNRRPLFSAATGESNNFNPTIVFDGSSDRMPILDKFYDGTSLLNQVNILTVYKTSGSGDWAFIDYDRSEWYNTEVQNNDLRFAYRGITAIQDNSVDVGTPRDGRPHIAAFIYDNTLTNETVMRYDGAEVYAEDRQLSGIPLEDATTRFGYIGDGSEAATFDSGANNRFYEGDISEIIVYDNLSFSAADRRRLETYLALKYGITLDGSSSHYESPNGANLFAIDDGANGGAASDQLADWSDIAGLGYDSTSTLDQRIARSVNASAELTAATSNDFSSANTNSRPSIAEGAHLVWGHNGGLVSARTTNDIDTGVYSSRIPREWKFQAIGYTQDTYLKIENLPALAPGKSYQLLYDADGDFTSGALLIATSTDGEFGPVTPINGTGYVTVAFLDDDIEVEFSAASSGDLEASGANLPLILVNGAVTSSIVFNVTLSSADAVPGDDYNIAATTIPAGTYDGTLATAIPLNLSILDDNNVELDETLLIQIDPTANPAVDIVDINGDSVARDSTEYIIEDDDKGPGGLGDQVLFWLRADRGTSTLTDGAGLQLWEDQLPPDVDAYQNTATLQPSFENAVADLWNFNPNLRFDGVDDYLELNDSAITNLAESQFKVLHLAFITGPDVNSQQLLYKEGGTIRGFNAYIQNGELSFGAYNFPDDGPGSPWDFSDCDISIQPNTRYIATMHMKGNSSSTGSIQCYLNAEQSAAPGTNIGFLYPHSGDASIGTVEEDTFFDDGSATGQALGTGDAPYDGQIAEIIYFGDADQNTADRNQVESYLALKYGVTLFQGAGGTNYVNSVAQVIYDATGTHSGFRNDIAGISSDSGSDFIQPRSKSINPDAFFTIGNADDLGNYESLVWGNNGAGLSGWSASGMALGYESLPRKWRFDEQGDVGAIDLEFDAASLPAIDKDAVVLLVDADGDFSSGAAVYPLSLSAGIYSATGVEPGGDSYFTIAQRDITPPALSLVSAVATPTTDNTPAFSFSSTEAGTITMGGACNTATLSVSAGTTTINLDADGSGTGLADGSYSGCTITVTDNCGNVSNALTIPDFEVYATVPAVSITVDNATISESAGVATFTLSLSNQYAAATTTDLALSGTATAADYSNSSLSVTIPALSTSGSFTVTATEDAFDEFDETVIVDIDSVTNGTEDGVQQAITTITDNDDQPSVTLSVDTTSIAEAGGVAVITATLNVVSGRTVTVSLDFASSSATLGADYSLSAANISIPAGSSSASITLTAVDDADDDDEETVVAAIDAVSNGVESGTQQVSIIIIDDDIACNDDPWEAPVATAGVIVMSADGTFTDSGGYTVPRGGDFDTIVMGRNAADAQTRREEAFDYFLNTFGVDWYSANRINSSTWATPSGDMLLLHAMTDPRYDYKLNAASERRLHQQNGEVYEGVYLMVVMSPAGAIMYGNYGGAGGEYVPQGAAMINGEVFSSVPVLCRDGSIRPETFYMKYQSIEPTKNNPQDKVLYNDEVVSNDRYMTSFAVSLSRKGLHIEPGTNIIEAQVVNIVQFYP